MPEHSLKPLSFFVAVHKDAPLPPPCDNYFTLGIGGYKPSAYPSALTDSAGESISHKNKHYCELTGWYWIWKNISDVKILGLCHYRRYFVLDDKGLRRRKKYFRPTVQNFEYITAPKCTTFAEKTLSRYDIIVPKRASLRVPLSRHYAAYHIQEDWDLFIQGIQELYPQYAAEIGWFDNMRYIHPYNMMIASKPFFDAYMSSLFTLLFWMEDKRPFRSDPYQCRVPAFLAERFFTFYLHVTGTRFAEVPIAISEATAF